MKKLKRNLRKLTSIGLLFTVLGVTCINSTNLFCKDSISYAQSSSVYVQKIDDNHAKLHCDSVKTSNGDFLFIKTQTSDGFQYDVYDLSGTQKFYGFNSSTDIKLDEGLSNNSQLCGIIWGAIAAPTAAGVTAAVGSTIAAGAAITPYVSAILTMGATGAAQGIAFSAGAGLAFGLIVASTPAIAMIGAAGGAVALG